MGRFNRTFYDLNNERHYCLTARKEEIPFLALSDLKISVPSYTDTPVLSGLLIEGETVQVVVSVNGEPAVTYSSSTRSTLRNGRTYPMRSWKEGYEGLVVFGNLKEDVRYRGSTAVSEECLSRFKPSAIPYVSIPCTDIRLTGEVSLGGNGTHSRSFVDTLPEGVAGAMFGGSVKETAILDLVDTGRRSADNPMLLYANGINAFNAVEGLFSPIYTVAGILPDAEGNIYAHFCEHFRIAAVGIPEDEEAEQPVPVSTAVVGSVITQDMVCYPPPHESSGVKRDEEECLIEFIEVERAPDFC